MNMPYLLRAVAVVFVASVAVFISAYSGGQTTVEVSEPQRAAATSTAIDLESEEAAAARVANAVATTSLPIQIPVIPKAEIPRKKQTIAPAPKVATATVSVQPVALAPEPEPVARSAGPSDLDAAAAKLRGALVNILCYAPVGSPLHSISASGIFIDAKGIILTDAHVAQYFLLADRKVDCTIRTGSPASDSYDAALIFISPAWLRANSSVLTERAPSGNGQYDYAFLAITKALNGKTLPEAFPAIPLDVSPPEPQTPVVIATYGAQFLESNQIMSALFPTVVFGSVKDVFTFDTNTVDVIALGGSAAAQEGSSGGGVANAAGELIGTITTSTVTGSTDTRSLNAITAPYIRAEYARETGTSLDALLSMPTAVAVASYAPQLSDLEKIITASLP